jgi:hypothetical protein
MFVKSLVEGHDMLTCHLDIYYLQASKKSLKRQLNSMFDMRSF